MWKSNPKTKDACEGSFQGIFFAHEFTEIHWKFSKPIWKPYIYNLHRISSPWICPFFHFLKPYPAFNHKRILGAYGAPCSPVGYNISLWQKFYSTWITIQSFMNILSLKTLWTIFKIQKCEPCIIARNRLHVAQ